MTGTETYTILILINVRWWNATAFYAVNIGRILQKKGHRVFIGCNEAYPAYRIAKSYGLAIIPLNFYGYNLIQLFKSFIRIPNNGFGTDELRIYNVGAKLFADHTKGIVAYIFHRGQEKPLVYFMLSVFYNH